MIPLRLAQELTYQLEASDQKERLVVALGTIPIFLTLFLESRTELLALWRRLAAVGYDPEPVYRDEINRAVLGKGELYKTAITSLQQFFRARSAMVPMAHFVRLGLELSQAHGDMHSEMELLRLLGWIELQYGQLQAAMEYFQRSKKMAEAANNTLSLARVLGDIGAIHHRLREPEPTRAYWTQQLELSEAISYEEGIAVANDNLGDLEMRSGRYDSAIAHRQAALRYYEDKGDLQQTASVLSSLANVYENQGKFQEAERYFKRALKISEDLGDLITVGLSLGNYAVTLKKRGEVAAAIPLVRRALEVHRSVKYSYGQTYWLLLLAQSLLEGDPTSLAPSELAEVEHLIAECIALSKEISNMETARQAEILLHKCYLARGDTASAIAHLRSIGKAATDLLQSASAHVALWRITKAEDDRYAAISTMESLIATAPQSQFKEILAELQQNSTPVNESEERRN